MQIVIIMLDPEGRACGRPTTLAEAPSSAVGGRDGAAWTNRCRTPEPARIFERLPAAIDRVLEPAQRAGDDELLEWAGLAALDATDVGEQRCTLLGCSRGPRPCTG